MAYIDFISELHSKTKRDYVQRVVENDKAECSKIAKQYDKDYWDGDRKYGYGGYKYDGRWSTVAEKMIQYYGLKDGDSILDVCSGKGFLLYEFKKLLPNSKVAGLDISEYAIENAKEEIKPFLTKGHAKKLPYKENEFDFVVSLGGLHNLPISELGTAVKEIERVGNRQKYIMVESWRNESEKANLLYWQLTCESFHDVESWAWIYKNNGYTGDWGFIFFE